MECKKSLFVDDSEARGRKRILLVLLAGKSKDDVSTAAGELKGAGVKIITVGIGVSIVRAQLAVMASSSTYILNTPSFDLLAGIRGTVTNMLSRGSFKMIHIYIHLIAIMLS